jgi:predicted nucleic acid-binding protein
MRKVVSNTTPIISLLKIEHLHLLKLLYSSVIVPHAVWQEVEAGKRGPFYADLKALPWIDIQEIQSQVAAEYLTDLDRGEAEVIILAREIGADLVIIDEALGRHYAQHFGLRLTGTLGVLLRAKKEGYVSEIKPLLELLRAKGIWISDRVIKDVLSLAGE